MVVPNLSQKPSPSESASESASEIRGGREALSVRAAAPARIELPQTPGFLWRPANAGDIDTVLQLLQAAGRVDHPSYALIREDVADDFSSAHIEAASDTLIAIDDAGRAVGYGSVACSPARELFVRSTIEGTVHPDFRGRGLGRALLTWQEQRARQQFAQIDSNADGWIINFLSDAAASAIALFERHGFATARHYWELHRPLSQPIDEVALPDGIRTVGLREVAADALLAAKNDAFRDHWGSLPLNAEQWSKVLKRRTLRPDLSVIAVTETGEIAGFLLTEVDESSWAAQGFSSAYIELVGVPRAHRGRRIAPAILAEALRRIRAEGLDRAVLDVDAANPTGALGLYQRSGFVEHSRGRDLLKVL